MRLIVIIAASIAAAQGPSAAPQVVLDNAHVRAYRTTADALARLEHGPAVVVSLENATLGTAVWVEDAAAPASASKTRGRVVVVFPRHAPSSPPPAAASQPGEAQFTGMSFKTIFQNERVSAIRARMEVGAREGFHTHASDTVVVHLTGGEIEDTANGKTVVNRWKRGDVEFEGLGTSHSARNVAGPVDVVLVALKP